MARPDHEEGRHRRWQEDARKYLGRGDLEGGLPALLRLPPPLREELLPRAAALFQGAVAEQHRRGMWGMLATLAARAEAEPRLVEQGVEPEQARALYWPLMWAAGRAREWARARRLWQPLAATLQERAPRLAEAVEAWLSAQGAPAAEAVAPVLACLPSMDSRLGIEQAPPRAAVPPPRSVEEVERAVLALCALEPFPVFARRVEAWAREAYEKVARAEWELAGQLAARELWLRAAAGKETVSLSEPALLLAQAVRETGSSGELSALVSQALRVLTARLPREAISNVGEAEAWCAMAEAAARLPDMRTWVMQAASELRFSQGALPRALRLYEAMLALAPDAALWARAFLAWDEEDSEGAHAPQWLQEGLRQLLATQAPALQSWLRRAGRPEATELLEGMAFTCSPGLVETWVEACWEEADEELRRMLSGAIAILLDRSRLKKADRQLEREVFSAPSLDAAMRTLMAGLTEERLERGALSKEGLRIWRRFGPRMLAYDTDLLREAVRQASSSAEAWEAAERYLKANSGDAAYVDALNALERGGWKELTERVLGQWLERCAGSPQALAEAGLAGSAMGLPCRYLHPVLAAFLEALAGRAPMASISPTVAAARELAHEHEVKRPRRRASRKKAAGAATKRKSSPRKKGGAT